MGLSSKLDRQGQCPEGMHSLTGCRQWPRQLVARGCWRVCEETRRGELEARRWVDGPPPPAWGGGLTQDSDGVGSSGGALPGVKGGVMRGRAWGGWHLQDRIPGGFSAYSLFLTPCNWKQGVLLNIRANYTIPPFRKINKSEGMNEQKNLKNFFTARGVKLECLELVQEATPSVAFELLWPCLQQFRRCCWSCSHTQLLLFPERERQVTTELPFFHSPCFAWSVLPSCSQVGGLLLPL